MAVFKANDNNNFGGDPTFMQFLKDDEILNTPSNALANNDISQTNLNNNPDINANQSILKPDSSKVENKVIASSTNHNANRDRSPSMQSVDLNKNQMEEAAVLNMSTQMEKNKIASKPIEYDNEQYTGNSAGGRQFLKKKTDPPAKRSSNSNFEISTSSNHQNYNRPRSQLSNNLPSIDVRQQIVSNQSSNVQIPIIGYEIMEERARFTIYKLRIDDPRTGLSWMVFRRYTDFVRLYSKLKAMYSNLNISLPRKRWFKDNFDPLFLDERVRGLQLFVNAVIRSVSSEVMVRDFFCLDEPPPLCDSEPESLALFGALEDTVGSLKNQIRQKDETIDYLRKKVMYFEDKMKNCQDCNPNGRKFVAANDKCVPGSSASSNCS